MPDATHIARLRRFITALVLGWTLLMGLSLAASLHWLRDAHMDLIRMQARTAYEKDVTYRAWNAAHGGVYVPVTGSLTPNPYLDMDPHRDLITVEGVQYTKINPAYMTRQVHELQRKREGVLGHITSLDPIQPANAPDAWETNALRAFEAGTPEVSGLDRIGGEPYLRLMRPLFVEQSCMPCHAEQGYVVGDVRGGIGVAVPLAPTQSTLQTYSAALVGGHLGVWLLVLLGIGYGGRMLAGNVRREHAAREQLRRANTELAQARDDALAGSRAKSQFLASMSHEVRTPMNGVLGMLDLLLLTDLSDEQRDLAATSRDAGSELLTLLNDVLDMSKCEAGGLQVEQVPVALNDLLERVTRFVRPLAKNRGLAFELQVASTLPAFVRTDPTRLRQVLLNLLGNALKFTPEGAVGLRVSEDGRSGNQVTVRFDVTDTGPGIPHEKLNELFRPFHQLDASTTRVHGGTGLGLAISRELARALNGDITVESSAGEGSTFTLRVTAPVHVPAEGERHEADAPEQAPVTTEDVLPAVRVLVAEDNPVNLQVLTAMLRQLGCAHDTAPDGDAAVAAYKRNEYGLVLMDWHMPRLDGAEAARSIRAFEASSGRRARIVAVTADTMPGSRERCLTAGMDDYITKPVTLDALRTAVREAAAVQG